MRNESTAKLRSVVAAVRDQRKSQGRRYPKELRRRIVSHAISERSKGVSVRLSARSLGLSYPTLLGWLQTVESNGFRSVAVKQSAPENDAATSLCMVTPQGHRVEGLNREDIAFLLRSLT